MNLSWSFLASLLATTTVYGWTKNLEDGTALIMCDLDGIVQQVLVEEGQIVQGGHVLCWTKALETFDGYSSPGECTVSKVLIKEKQPVFKDDVLFVLMPLEGQQQQQME